MSAASEIKDGKENTTKKFKYTIRVKSFMGESEEIVEVDESKCSKLEKFFIHVTSTFGMVSMVIGCFNMDLFTFYKVEKTSMPECGPVTDEIVKTDLLNRMQEIVKESNYYDQNFVFQVFGNDIKKVRMSYNCSNFADFVHDVQYIA